MNSAESRKSKATSVTIMRRSRSSHLRGYRLKAGTCHRPHQRTPTAGFLDNMCTMRAMARKASVTRVNMTRIKSWRLQRLCISYSRSELAYLSKNHFFFCWLLSFGAVVLLHVGTVYEYLYSTLYVCMCVMYVPVCVP